LRTFFIILNVLKTICAFSSHLFVVLSLIQFLVRKK